MAGKHPVSSDFRGPRLQLLLLLFAFLFLAGGCGKKLPPLSRDAVVPGEVREFRLTQEGDSLVLSWLLPRVNAQGQPLTQIQGFRLYRAELKTVEPAPTYPDAFVLLADIDLAYPKAGELRGEAVLYRDRDLVSGRRYYYRVAAYDQDRYPGTVSKVLGHSWSFLPRAPQDLKAEPGDKAVRLLWQPVTLMDGRPVTDLAGYLIYRRSGEGGVWLRLTPNPVVENNYQDLAVLNDVDYTYKVRAARRLGGDLLESVDSPTRMAMPEKMTPPPPLLNLVASPAEKGLVLRWDPSPARDLAGYRVYRRSAGEEKFVRLTLKLLTRPYYEDNQAARGQTYHYYVTAVDDSRRANESLPSEVGSITY
jgi:uncharacterized protein